MKVINYITFKNNDEFVAWQLEEQRSIISISPQMMEMEIDLDEIGETGTSKNINGTGRLSTGVFITYAEETE